jgi:hypothetical protein
VAAVALAVALVVLRPWPPDGPVVYGGDLFQHLALVQSSDLLGSPGPTERLAAPDGLDWSAFPTGGERLHLIALRTLTAVTGDIHVAVTLFLVGGLVVTALVAFAVLRWLGVRPLFAGATAVAFSFGAGFGERLLPGHLFLCLLYPVPLGVYLAVWASWPGRVRDRRWAPPALAAAVVAVSSSYYAAFTLVAIAGLGLAVAARRRDPRRLAAPALVVAAVVVVAGASLAPQLAARAGTPTEDAMVRTAGDADRYALHLPQLLLPRDDHPVPAMAALGRAAAPDGRPGDRGAVLGLVGTAALLCTLVAGAAHGRRPRDRTDRTVARLAVLAVVATAMAAVGGPVLADLGLTQIRAWSRMAVFVAFVSLAGLALLAQRWAGPGSRPRLVPAVVALVTLAALVETAVVLPTRELTRRARDADAALVAGLDAGLGPGGSVFQLPVVSFPDDVGAERLLAPSVAAARDGRDLRFSAGFFRGGGQDWQSSWAAQPVPRLVAGVAAAGFDALMVDLGHHLLGDPAPLVADLTAELGPPTVSRDRRFAWWDLRPLRAALVAGHGRPAVERAGGLVRRRIGVGYRDTVRLRRDGRVLGPRGAVELRRLDGDRSPVGLTMAVLAAPGREVAVTVDGSERRYRAGAAGRVRVSVRVVPDAPVTEVRVREAAGGSVEVRELAVRDLRLDGDPVLPPAQVGARNPVR